MGEVRIFISYAREDHSRVNELYQRLVAYGFAPWLDREHIIPGMRWEPIIKTALKQSDFVLVCLSANSINKRGFLQREIKQALEQAEEKLEHDVYLIPARLDDCDVPEVLADIQWVDLFDENGWQWLLKAIEYGLKQSGKNMPLPVSYDAPTDAGEDQHRQEQVARQRELEDVRRAEAARLAEEKRQQDESRHRELQAQQQREVEAKRQRELEQQRLAEAARLAEEKRKEEEQRRRAEVARPPIEPQPQRPKKELKTQPLNVLPLRSRRLFIGVGGALTLVTLVGWLVALYTTPTDQRPWNRKTASPSLQTASSPIATPTTTMPVEVLRYRQEFESGGFRFRFTAREDGYLYLVAPDKAGVLFPLLTNRLGAQINRLRAGAEFVFPARPAAPLKLSEEKASFTLIFSARQLTQPDFVSASEARDLTDAEQRALVDLRNNAKTERTPVDRGGTITALPGDKAQLTVDIVANRSASQAVSR